MRLSAVERVLIWGAFIALPFTDSPLSTTPLGFLGASPSFIPLGLLICLYSLGFMLNRLCLPLTVLLAVLWAGAIGVYGLWVYGSSAVGENLVDKGLRLAVLLALFFMPFALMLRHRAMRYGSLGALLILLGGVVWVDVLGNTMFLHGSPNGNMRPRGFTLESSHLSMIVIALTTLSISTLRRPVLQLAVGAIGLAVLVYSGSKGGVAVLIAGCALLAVFYLTYAFFFGRISRWIGYMLPFVAIAGFGLSALSQQVVEGIVGDLEQFTSSATRVTLVFSSLRVVSQHPLGVGTTGYLPALVENIPPAIRTLEVYSPIKLNFEEVEAYTASQSDQDISTKSFFFDGLIYFGIPFGLAFTVGSLWLLMNLFRRREWVLFVGSAALILGLVVFSGGLGLYAISFALAWAKTRATWPTATSDSRTILLLSRSNPMP